MVVTFISSLALSLHLITCRQWMGVDQKGKYQRTVAAAHYILQSRQWCALARVGLCTHNLSVYLGMEKIKQTISVHLDDNTKLPYTWTKIRAFVYLSKITEALVLSQWAGLFYSTLWWRCWGRIALLCMPSLSSPLFNQSTNESTISQKAVLKMLVFHYQV